MTEKQLLLSWRAVFWFGVVGTAFTLGLAFWNALLRHPALCLLDINIIGVNGWAVQRSIRGIRRHSHGETVARRGRRA